MIVIGRILGLLAPQVQPRQSGTSTLLFIPNVFEARPLVLFIPPHTYLVREMYDRRGLEAGRVVAESVVAPARVLLTFG